MDSKVQDRKVVNLVLNCTSITDTSVTTFKQKLFVNIAGVSGFYVKQVAYKNKLTGQRSFDAYAIRKETGEIAPVYDETKDTAYPVASIIPPESDIYNLRCDLTDTPLCTFMDGTNACPNTFFKLSKDVNGTYTFYVNTADNTDSQTPSTTAKGVLSVVLEFVKF